MAQTKESGQQHFTDAAKTIEETSSDGRFSSYQTSKGVGLDGPQVQQVRGKPAKRKR